MTAKKKPLPNKKTSPAVTHFPSPLVKKAVEKDDKEKIKTIGHHVRCIMEALGLDLENDSLKDTPNRIARMYVEEVFSGLKEDTFPKISFFEEVAHHQHQANIVFVKVSFTSFCEHHFVPMVGSVYVAYLPQEKLIGLSKIPRIVRYFAKRPQLQERLTAQVADSLAILLETADIAVSVNARHFCVMARGIQDEQSHTITNVLRGRFNTDQNLRAEFFESVNRHSD